jgi:hypothetical protein
MNCDFATFHFLEIQHHLLCNESYSDRKRNHRDSNSKMKILVQHKASFLKIFSTLLLEENETIPYLSCTESYHEVSTVLDIQLQSGATHV